MAKVYPGSDFQDIYSARGIVSTHLQGDDFKVRRSANDKNLDPRANSEWQQKIIDNFSLASRIWKNKQNCWKDHFKRSKKTFEYSATEGVSLKKELSGYKLAINMLLSSLSGGSSGFYDPPCFCITPTDLFGDPHTSFSRLMIEYNKPVEYAYDEIKQTLRGEFVDNAGLDRFCSATLPIFEEYDKCLLNTLGCVSRDNKRFMDYRALDTINKIVMWPDIRFKPVDDFIHGDFGLHNYEYWIYRKKRPDELDPSDPTKRGFEAVLQWPYYRNDLCCRKNIIIDLYYGYYTFQGSVTGTNQPPFFDVYQGDNFIGRVGNGCGGTISHAIPNVPSDMSQPSSLKFSFHENLYPVVDGWQPHQYPPGKLYEARLSEIQLGPLHPYTCAYNHIVHVFKTSEPVWFDIDRNIPFMKFNLHSRYYYPPYLSHWYPYGAIWPYAVDDVGNWWPLIFPGNNIEINGNQWEYCFRNLSFDGLVDTFVLYERSSPGPWVGSCVRSFIGDSMCEADKGACKEPIPKPGQRGFWLLDPTRDFQITDPCCRCPEEYCPKCIKTLPKCPDTNNLFRVGNECLPCEGASSQYHVYDYLI